MFETAGVHRDQFSDEGNRKTSESLNSKFDKESRWQTS